jgi:dipeptidyl aminopeptidase/acylaminoacyl peptidase
MRAAVVLTALLFVLLAPCAASAQEAAGYPLEEYLGVTSFAGVTVSPDGRHVAFVASEDDFEENKRRSAIWRVDLDDAGRKVDQVRLAASEGSYSQLRWSPDGRYLLYVHSEEEAKSHIFALDMRGGEARRLTDPEHYSEGVGSFDLLGAAELVLTAPVPKTEDEEKEIEEFYGDVMRFVDEPTTTWVARLGIVAEDATGERIATVQLPIQDIWASSDGSQVALSTTARSTPQRFFNDFGASEVYLLSSDGTDEPTRLTRNLVLEGNLEWREGDNGFYAAGIGDPNDSRGRYTQGRLFTIGMDGSIENLAPGFIGAFSAPYVVLPDGSLLASAAVSTRTNIHRVDPDNGDVERLTDFAGAVSNLSASADGNVIAFALISDRSAPEVYVAVGLDDLESAEPITEFNVGFNSHPMPEIEAIAWPNGEGDEIEGILFWPPGRKGEPGLPLVVDIHGGPWSLRTENIGPISFAYYPALLASRGYLVLEANYRGGTGRGDEFLHAIEGYSCTRPATDILTGVDFLVEQGWADPDRMAVMGYSYGGVMTNCIIGLTDRFRAAASGAGIWNDISYFGTADNFIQNDVRNNATAPWENLENYWKESAISRAGNISTPTLVTIGGADRRVPTTQGYELYRALVRLGVPAELLVFPEEPHGFRQPKHKLTKVKAELRWIDRYLREKDVTLVH